MSVFSSLPSPLPIDEVLPGLLAELDRHGSVVLRAPPGAGKTTRVPPALADAFSDGQIVVLEPRRLAARAASRRIAEERGWRLGDEVGYWIRFERRASSRTRLLVVTEGILVQMLQRDPFLDGVSALVFDEFHERHLASDLALAMARRVRREARPDLRLVVMSATLEPAPIAAFLGGCPVVDSPGRLYPVEVRHLERPETRALPMAVVAGVRNALAAGDGDVLAFLPGVGEIRRTAELLAPLAEQHGLAVHTLYGALDGARQDAALRPGQRRKVVLATNVAETSVTVAGVTAVVDSGFARQPRFDAALGLDRLALVRISRAAAAQRAGRAGRERAGVCLRLWTEYEERSLADRELPEVRRVDLAGPALQLLAWGEIDLERFGWFEAPAPAVLERALGLLRELGAIDGGGGLTRRGRAMARLPIHPRLARLVVAGFAAGVGRRAALLAALLSERDLVHRPVGQRPVMARRSARSDVLDRLQALEDLAAGGHGETALGPIHPGRARQTLRIGEQLAQIGERVLGDSPGDDRSTLQLDDEDDALLLALFTAYPDRLARRREPGGRRALMVGGRGVRLASMSAVRDPELFLCVEIDAGGGEALVRQASEVSPDWLHDELETSLEARYDDERDRVIGRRAARYRDLIVAESEHDPGAEAAAEVLVAAARDELERALPEDGALASFLTRWRCLAEWLPDLDLPALDHECLAELLPFLAAGCRSLAELRRAPWLATLRGTLDPSHLRALDEEAPEHLVVPSGSRRRLSYEAGKPPVLAVRIQEVLGLAETPRVARGRVAVLLHLLAPNGRPQQITQDLASFWRRTYPEVRRELLGRYPRHAWPTDPLTAPAESRPQRRRR